MSNRLVILGAGGHAVELWEIVHSSGALAGTHHLVGFISPDGPALLLDQTVTGDDSMLRSEAIDVLIGVNNPADRARLDHQVTQWGCGSVVAVHDAATVGAYVEMAPGVAIHAGARVGSRTTLGRHSYVAPNAVVGHDCVVGAYCSLLPGSMVSGAVTIGDRVQIGAGAIVLQGRRIDAGATVGAGAVVTHNVEAGNTVVGVPARAMPEQRGSN